MLILRIVVFIVGTYLSCNMPFFGYVGMIFGSVVIIWHWSFTRKLYWFRWSGFFLSSTLIFILVLRISDLHIFKADIYYYILNPSIGAGTVLTLLAHKLFLKASWLRIAIAISGVYVISMLALWLTGKIFYDLFSFSVLPPISDIVNTITLWQGAYLMFMFYRHDNYYSPQPGRD